MADQSPCKRCQRRTRKPLTLYMGLIQESAPPALIPLQGVSLTGGTLEICTDCHAEWIAAIKTWFENPTLLRIARPRRTTDKQPESL